MSQIVFLLMILAFPMVFGQCPHANFVNKHVCGFCHDADTALQFSRARRCVPARGGWMCDHNTNTVITGYSYASTTPDINGKRTQKSFFEHHIFGFLQMDTEHRI